MKKKGIPLSFTVLLIFIGAFIITLKVDDAAVKNAASPPVVKSLSLIGFIKAGTKDGVGGYDSISIGWVRCRKFCADPDTY